MSDPQNTDPPIVSSRRVLLLWDNGENHEDHRVYFVQCKSVDEAKALRDLADKLTRIDPNGMRAQGYALGIVEIEEWLSRTGELRTIAWFLTSGPFVRCHSMACRYPATGCVCGQTIADYWISMSLRRGEPGEERQNTEVSA